MRPDNHLLRSINRNTSPVLDWLACIACGAVLGAMLTGWPIL